MTGPATVRPVLGSERIEALDVLRGVAVLMIFVVNVKAMAAPPSYFFSPEAWAPSY